MDRIFIVKRVAIFSLASAIIYILFQSIQPVFYTHLYPDVFTFHARAAHFWEHLSLTQLGHNEYQPGAMIFFILVGLSSLYNDSIETFTWALFFANIIFIILTSFLFHKMQKTAGVILLSLLLIFLGPILLFRFDLLVIFLVTLVFYLWEKDKFEWAMAVLSFSVLVKVYPLIFLPYLLFLSIRKRTLRYGGYLLLVFIVSIAGYFLLYSFAFQVGLTDSYASYNFHNLKSVATESIWASLFYFAHTIRGVVLPGMESAYGINAIVKADVVPSINFYNYFWMLPLGIFNMYYFVRFRKQSDQHVDYKFIAASMIIFLVFSKVFFNQYWAWFLFLLPLLKFKTLLSKGWMVNIFLIILATIMRTFIYPLHYSEWLAALNGGTANPILLWTMMISSFILIVLAARITVDVFLKEKNG